MTVQISEFEISPFAERARKASQASKEGRQAHKGRKQCISTSDKDYTPEEMAFLAGIESFKNQTGRKFPTWTEVLGVVKSLGYKRND